MRRHSGSLNSSLVLKLFTANCFTGSFLRATIIFTQIFCILGVDVFPYYTSNVIVIMQYELCYGIYQGNTVMR